MYSVRSPRTPRSKVGEGGRLYSNKELSSTTITIIKANSVLRVTGMDSFTLHANPVKKSVSIDEETGTLSQMHTSKKWEIQDINQSGLTAEAVLLAATSDGPQSKNSLRT